VLGVAACRSTPIQQPSEAARRALAAGETKWMTVNGLRLKTKIYKSKAQGDRPTLLLVLHGDSPNGPPSIQDVFAQTASEHLENAIVAGVLRPGYTDGAGDTSDGERGRATGDNYTPQVVDAVAQLLRDLKKEYAPGSAVMVGHSGGAAIAANVLGRWPSEANAALLISCPCNVPAWRSHMMKTYFRSYGPLALVFSLPTDSLSPLDLANGLSPRLPVRMIVGENDTVAPARFTREYAESLRRHGTNVTVTVTPGLGHDIFLKPFVFEDLERLVAETVGANR
jgi:pimeloyl-ACP methyl ester carboxylesterase